MNEFDNFPMRSVGLPTGCKDLIEVLPKRGRQRTVDLPGKRVAEVEPVLVTLLEPSGDAKGFSMSSSDYQKHLSVHHRNGMFSVMALLNANDAASVQAAIDLFREAGLVLKCDQDCQVDGVPLRLLLCPLPAAAEEAAALIRAFWQKVHRVADDARLYFNFFKKRVT